MEPLTTRRRSNLMISTEKGQHVERLGLLTARGSHNPSARDENIRRVVTAEFTNRARHI